MKLLKKIFIIVILGIIIIGSNSYAASLIFEREDIINDERIVTKKYIVSAEEEQEFSNNLESIIEKEKNTYILQNKEKTGGTIIEEKTIETTRSIETKNNEIEKILEEVEHQIEYLEDEFIGIYYIDQNSIKIESIYNGYREVLIEETIVYENLETNDLVNIPKEIKKNGSTLNLISNSWDIVETSEMQENNIPSKYKATSYYASKIRVDNPLTYIATISYTGTAEKIIENDYTYKITYIEKEKEEENNLLLPTIIGSGMIIVLLAIYLNNTNTIIYNYQNEEWKKVGRARLSKPCLVLNKYITKKSSSKYRIELDNKLLDKYNKKMFEVIKDDKVKKVLINKQNNVEPYIIEISI